MIGTEKWISSYGNATTMQSKGSSSLLEPGDFKLSVGSMLGGGVTDGAWTAIVADFFTFRVSCLTQAQANILFTRFSLRLSLRSSLWLLGHT
jgi:hypothetical protein